MGIHVRDRGSLIPDYVMVQRQQVRAHVEALIDALIDLLDELDGDPEREPSLGSPECSLPQWSRYAAPSGYLLGSEGASQEQWAQGGISDLEESDGDEEPDDNGVADTCVF